MRILCLLLCSMEIPRNLYTRRTSPQIAPYSSLYPKSSYRDAKVNVMHNFIQIREAFATFVSVACSFANDLCSVSDLPVYDDDYNDDAACYLDK